MSVYIPSTTSDVLTTEHIQKFKRRLLNDQERTGGHIDNGLTIIELTQTPLTLPNWTLEEPCQEDWSAEDWGKRDRIAANKGKRDKAKTKNRKAAKAARRARKASR